MVKHSRAEMETETRADMEMGTDMQVEQDAVQQDAHEEEESRRRQPMAQTCS